MKNRVILTIAALALQVNAGERQEPARFQIDGVVLDSGTSRPLEEVRVEALPGGRTAITDAQGRFVLRLEASGRYQLVPTRNGFVSSRLEFSFDPATWVQVLPDQRIKPVELMMSPSGVVTGTVFDPNGQPLPGTLSSVSLLRRTYDENGKRRLVPAPVPYESPQTTVVRMDDRGRYRFFGVPPGDYYVRVGGSIASRPSTYYPGVTEEGKAGLIHVAAGDEVNLGTMIVSNYKTVHLKLHLVGGSPNMNPPITALRFTKESNLVGSFIFTSERRNGQVELEIAIAPSEKYSVLAQWMVPNDLLYGKSELLVGSSDLESTILMKPAYHVTGTIESTEGKAEVSGVRCRLQSEDLFANWSNLLSCIGNQYSEGTYWLDVDSLPPDAYVATATASGRDILKQPLLLNSDTDLDIRVGLQGGILEGRVQDAMGNSISQASVVLIPEETLRSAHLLYKTGISDTSGRYEIHGIRPGMYRAFAWCRLDGRAYLNDDFVKTYEDQGKDLRIEANMARRLDLVGCN